MHAISRNITKAAPAVSKISNLSEIKAVRCVATTTKNTAASAQEKQDERQEAKAKKMKKAVHSKSYVQNIFRGIVEPEQAFPYPNTLDQDQRDTLEMLVPITEKFFMEQNDPLKNDADAKVPENTVQVRMIITMAALRLNILSSLFTRVKNFYSPNVGTSRTRSIWFTSTRRSWRSRFMQHTICKANRNRWRK